VLDVVWRGLDVCATPLESPRLKKKKKKKKKKSASRCSCAATGGREDARPKKSHPAEVSQDRSIEGLLEWHSTF